MIHISILLVLQKFLKNNVILDKPRISMKLDEFKQYYGGFVKLMCRINAVPRPSRLEMRVGGILIIIIKNELLIALYFINVPKIRCFESHLDVAYYF